MSIRACGIVGAAVAMAACSSSGLENDATTKCLEGRGHSVIGVAKK